MKNQHEAATARHLRNLKGVRWLIVILLMFCFTECATGSCLSYGHSCWGAHGKRSTDGPISQHRQIDTREDGRPTGDGGTVDNPTIRNSQNPWFLAHLINRRLAVPAINTMVNTNLGNRWHKRQSLLSLSGGWNNDYATTSDEISGNDKTEIEKSIEDSKDSDYSFDLTRKMAKARDDITELLAIPPHGEYVRHYPSHPSKLRLYKILTDTSDDDTL